VDTCSHASCETRHNRAKQVRFPIVWRRLDLKSEWTCSLLFISVSIHNFLNLAERLNVGLLSAGKEGVWGLIQWSLLLTSIDSGPSELGWPAGKPYWTSVFNKGSRRLSWRSLARQTLLSWNSKDVSLEFERRGLGQGWGWKEEEREREWSVMMMIEKVQLEGRPFYCSPFIKSDQVLFQLQNDFVLNSSVSSSNQSKVVSKSDH
jgi:hypothetical protein